MSIKINLDNSIFTEIIDLETNEPYVLHLLEMKRSGYSEKVYKEYSEVLEKIQKECFEELRAEYKEHLLKSMQKTYNAWLKKEQIDEEEPHPDC